MKFKHLIFCALSPLLVACVPSNIPASQIDSISEYEDGVAIVTTVDSKHCFVDSELVPVGDGVRFDELSEFIDGYVAVPWGRIGYIEEFSNGLAVASNSTQGGIRDFSDGVERYGRSGIYYPKYGYIDESGEWAIPEKFFGAEKFNEEGYARVLTKHYALYSEIEYHYIDESGKVLSGKELDAALRSFR